jgi:hypothetical protein
VDYRFDLLGARAFEHLSQALVLNYMGISGAVFGDGADGGREATFSGQTTYDTGAGPWNGYVVMQAKFRQRPEGTSADGAWFVEQLKAELAEFGKAGSKRKRPDFYLVITNVALGPAQDAGAKDKAMEVLASSPLDFSGYDIWDYDKLRALVDGAEGIRRTYAAWITPGDVLHAALEHFESSTPDLEGTLSRYLQLEMLSDQFANLEQAGHSPDDRVPMASVFVDLPVRAAESDESDEGRAFVADLLETATERLALSSLKDNPVDGARSVLVGGPGQGKTTLGQFVCQLFRAAMLRDRLDKLDPEAVTVVELVEEWCRRDGTQLPEIRRFPLRISLSHFAKALADETSDTTSVMSYLTSRISVRTDTSLDPQTFRRWLGEIPWLLVLDGLDEVPPSSNRASVMDAIRDFMVEVAEADADVLVLATTRPQGYSEEFSPKNYRHRYLVPLTAERALAYGQRLSEVRFGEDPDRFERVVARLASAVANQTTARLMSSPLQVTIMTILVDKQGHPPQERWSLFSAYYSAIFSRELERDVETSRVLREHKANVDAIHRRVGLVLQSESEQAAGTDAQMSEDRFRALVRDRLEEEGYVGEELDLVEADIVEAAANRLVFLVGLETGVVGFEIRSLQEFMAAEGLMEAGDAWVHDRLAAIAASPSWRNVFLFAAGFCFAERQYLRDTVYTIAASMNESQDRALTLSCEGSRLAIDLLDEGTVRQQPKYARLFVGLALEVLRLPPAGGRPDIADVYTDTHEATYREALTGHLSHSTFDERLGAWSCLAGLATRGVVWASNICVDQWPADAADGRRLLNMVTRSTGDARLNQTVVREALRQPQWGAGRSTPGQAFAQDSSSPAWLQALAELRALRRNRRSRLHTTVGRVLVDGDIGMISELFASSADALADIPNEAEIHATWDAIRALGEFARRRDLSSAGAALRAASSLVADQIPTRLRSGIGAADAAWILEDWPWIFTSLVLSAADSADLARRADALERGDYGSVEDWLTREREWELGTWDLVRSAGEYSPDDPLRDVETSGYFPVCVYRSGVTPTAWPESAQRAEPETVEAIEALDSPGREIAAQLGVDASETFHAPRISQVGVLNAWCRLHELAGGTPYYVSSAFVVEAMTVEDPPDDDLMRRVGSVFDKYRVQAVPHGPIQGRDRLATRVRETLIAGGERRQDGLLKLLALTTRDDDSKLPALRAFVSLPDDQELRGAVLLLRMSGAGAWPQVKSDLVDWIIDGSYRLNLVREVGPAGAVSADEFIDLICTALERSARAAGDPYLRSELREAVGRRLTPLADYAMWSDFELFAPPPRELPAYPQGPDGVQTAGNSRQLRYPKQV